MLRNLFTHVLNTIFPSRCIGCRKEGTLFCASCLKTVSRATPAEHSFITALFSYRHPLVREAVWRFKYKNARGFANVFAAPLYEELVGELGENLDTSRRETFLLTPVPLHKKRLRERGYNQSELLARAIIACDRSDIFELASDILARTRATAPQARSEKRAARLANLRGAFTCPAPDRVRGRTVILIDDVTTTGATLLEAKRVLAKAKARRVLACTVAH